MAWGGAWHVVCCAGQPKLLAAPYLLAALAMSGLFGRVAQPAALMARHDEA